MNAAILIGLAVALGLVIFYVLALVTIGLMLAFKYPDDPLSSQESSNT